jgi:ribosomal protein S18 acetylase RimI-like enzyme
MEKKFEEIMEASVLKADGFKEEYLGDILKLEKECFPQEWQYENPADYYEQILKDEKNINLFLKLKDKTVGYIMAKPHNEIVDELIEEDSLLEKKENFYYIETIQIIPEAQAMGGAKKLLQTICSEASNMGINNFSIHARTMNGFSEKLKKIFQDKICLVRRIEKWKYADNEPYEYIEWRI